MAAASSSSSSVFLAMMNENRDNQIINLQQPQILPPPPPSSAPQQPQQSSNKKRRNLPGNPNPDAEVVALSPKTLMATNRFICEVCNKGFQREQNLQLHRRGHNLPWKLRQKSTKEQVRRKVYLCPEPTCVHHDPARALGDLTGIKKHYSRKHGEKKYKCEKCSKKYAVQSDWKAHSKTCGTKEYRCDCGTLFSRRDSFITHRAFCDALAQESARSLNAPTLSSITGSHLFGLSSQPQDHHQINHQPLSSHDILRLGSGARTRPGPQFESLLSPGYLPPQAATSAALFLQPNHEDSNGLVLPNKTPLHGLMQLPQLGQINGGGSSSSAAGGLFNLSFFPASGGGNADGGSGHHSGGAGEDPTTLFPSGHLMSIAIPSLYSTSIQNPTLPPAAAAAMSATALLQKAAQLGSTTSNTSSLFKTLGKPSSSSPLDTHTFGSAAVALFGSSNVSSDLVSSSSILRAAAGGYTTSHQDEEQKQLQDEYNNRISSWNDDKLGFDGRTMNGNHPAAGLSLEQDGRLTRDFLGVGEIVRSVREQQHNGILDMNTAAAAAAAAAYGKGINFQ